MLQLLTQLLSRRKLVAGAAIFLLLLLLAGPALGEVSAVRKPQPLLRGYLRQWRTTPELEEERRAAPSLPLRLQHRIAGDLDCDGRDELLFLSPDGSALISQRRETAPQMVEMRFALPAPVDPESLFTMAEASSSCPALFLAPQSRSMLLKIMHVDGGLQAEELSWPAPDKIQGLWNGNQGQSGFELIVLSGRDADRKLERWLLAQDGLRRLEGYKEQYFTAAAVVGVMEHPGYGRVPLIRDFYDSFPSGSWMLASGNYYYSFSSYTWGKEAVGDFNGDGREDLFVNSGGAHLSALILSFPESTIEQYLPRLPRLNEPFVAGDLDGNGLTDLLDVDGDGYRIFLARSGAAIGGARVQSSWGETAVTAADGSFSLPLSGGDGTVSASYTDAERVEMQIDAAITGARPRRPVLLFADPPAEDAVGAPIQVRGTAKGPFICHGFSPVRLGVGNFPWGRSAVCAPGWAMMELDDAPFAGGTCCRLPADDVLTGTSKWSSAPACPAHSVVTGIKEQDGEVQIRCSAIDTAKYLLLQPSSGTYWGVGYSSTSSKPGIDRSSFPLALRHGIGRLGFSRHDQDGCISQRAGSLLISRPHKDCSKTRFAALAHVGQTPPQPVVMYPDCERIEDVYNPLSGCILRKELQSK